MAPVNPHFKGKASFKGKNPKGNATGGHPSAINKKKKTWNPGNNFFQGSLQEGKGFAFQRKQKVQQEYKKLLQKEKWRTKDSKPKLEEEYPEHLRHLYIAEQLRLNEEEQLNRDRRRKGRSGDAGEEESVLTSSVTRISERGSPEKSAGPQISQIESAGQDQFKKKKWKKMSSNQKMIEEYKRKKEERERKREEYLNDKTQREEALKRYKQKKMATYQLLKKKTKKGQPNLNLQMELLLQKIQAQQK